MTLRVYDHSLESWVDMSPSKREFDEHSTKVGNESELGHVKVDNKTIKSTDGVISVDPNLINHVSNEDVHITSEERNNWTNKADEAFVEQKVADLVNTTAETLNTINDVTQAIAETESTLDGLFSVIGEKANTVELNNHIGDSNNPHNVTKEQVGLDKVDNTSDLEKPVSFLQDEAIKQATQNAINYAQSFGLGASAKSIIDANTAMLTGFYINLDNDSINFPPAPLNGRTMRFQLISMSTTNLNTTAQICISRHSNEIFMRSQYADVWTPWVKLIKETDIADATNSGLVKVDNKSIAIDNGIVNIPLNVKDTTQVGYDVVKFKRESIIKLPEYVGSQIIDVTVPKFENTVFQNSTITVYGANNKVNTCIVSHEDIDATQMLLKISTSTDNQTPYGLRVAITFSD